MESNRILAVVLAHGLNGLGAVRSLGTQGVPVVALVPSMDNACARSRYCRPVLRHEDEPLPTALARVLHDSGRDSAVVLATSDNGVLELAGCRPDLGPDLLTYIPSIDTLSLILDKRSEITAMQDLGVDMPRSHPCPPSAPAELLESLTLPIIFKPRTQELTFELGMKNIVVRTTSELDGFLTRFSRKIDLFVAQEVVQGGDNALWQCIVNVTSSGDLVSAFTFQKLGMAPPHFGVTTLGVSRRNREVVEIALRVARAVKYRGPAGFEFKRDARDGRLKFIEINPRFGMSNWFDACCGVRTVFRSYLLALGDETSREAVQQDGVYFLDLYEDLYSRLMGDNESLVNVAQRYSRLIGRRRVAAYWLASDPDPGMKVTFRRGHRIASSLATRLTGQDNRHVEPARLTNLGSQLPTRRIKQWLVRTLTTRPLRYAVNAALGEARATIFMLHRTLNAERPGSGHDLDFVSSAVDRLHALGCQFLPLSTLAEAACGLRSMNVPAVGFSIDDGYADQALLAERLLSKGIPVTLFTITDLVDGHDWPWDAKLSWCVYSSRAEALRLVFRHRSVCLSIGSSVERREALNRLVEHASRIPGRDVAQFVSKVADAASVEITTTPPESFRPLTWSDIRSLVNRGMDVGPHSRSHRIVSSLTDSEAEDELRGSWERVQSEVPRAAPMLAWPIGRRGDFGKRDQQLASRLGFAAAFAANDDYARLEPKGMARFAMSRFSMAKRLEDVVACATGIERIRQLLRGTRK